MNIDAGAPRVYVVDGDAAARESSKRLLQSLDYQVDVFVDGHAFLAHADLESAGCVVMDPDLPGLTGAELHERLRRAASPLAVVFLTARGDIQSAVASMQRGASDYLLKPVREQHLLDVVNRALRLSSAEAVQSRARRAVLGHLARLTQREQQVLKHLVEGVHYDRVSSALGITKRTVEAHRRRIMEKMGARTLPQLLQQLARIGWPGRELTRTHSN